MCFLRGSEGSKSSTCDGGHHIHYMTTRQLCSMVKERERGSANNAFILLGVDYCTERRGGSMGI